MANQIYYGASYPSGVGAGYTLRAAEAYLPATVGSSLYSANGIALTGVGEQASYIYSSQNNGLMPPGTEISGVGSVGNYSAGMIGSGLTSAAFRGADGLGMAATVNAGSKRSVEALYNQSILAHSTVAPSDALLSAYSLVKYPKLASASHLPIYPQRPGEKDCAHYMLTRTCKFGEACKFDHPIWVPEGGIPDWKEVPFVPASESLPQKPGEPDCPYFLKTQTCKYGLKCKFNHPKEKQNLPVTVFKTDGFLVNSELPQRPSEPVCSFYAKTGKCKFGASCKFNHPKDNQIQSAGYPEKNEETTNNYDATRGDPSHTKTFIPPALWHNSKGLPIRPGETDCPFYLKTGSCKFGATCRYNHPDRYFVDSTHTASINNAIITPTVAGLSYGVLNPAASYLPNIDPRLTQVGVTVYPQRPGEIECDYYMKTGHCKFGERCKYHHPIDRSAPPASSINPTQENVKLTLAGLPRREGALPCPFYMKTGTCKYGAVCKFDHPPPGEAIAMAQGSSGDTTSEEEEEEEEEVDT